MKARIHVTLKPGILDPQGKTIHHALESLGFAGIQEVRVGKLIELTFTGVSHDQARELAEQACRKLLANPVVEDYSLSMVDESTPR